VICIKTLNDINNDAKNAYPHLVVYAEDEEELFLLTNSEFWTIGRGGNNSIVLQDRWVSRHHATIQIVGSSIGHSQANQAIAPIVEIATEQSTSIQTATIGENSQPEPSQRAGYSPSFYLVDLGSRNGSFVNEHYLTFPIALKDGDRLTIGKTEIVFCKPPQAAEPADMLGSDLLDPPTLPARHSNLTPSEEKVFRQVVQGLTNKEIGIHLQISPRTVQTHLSSIMAKLNLENRSQIVRYAFQHGYRTTEAEFRI
jgi:DNA-binding CsgD family transcriptional regulator